MNRADLMKLMLDVATLLTDGGAAIDDVLKDENFQKTLADFKQLVNDLKREVK